MQLLWPFLTLCLPLKLPKPPQWFVFTLLFLQVTFSRVEWAPASSTQVCWDFCVLVAYFTMVSVSLLVADLILFWASRCVIPSVLTPSMAEMMSPWAKLPPTALLPGVICGGGKQSRSRSDHWYRFLREHTSGNHTPLCRHVHTL